jgi:hypothetical protein
MFVFVAVYGVWNTSMSLVASSFTIAAATEEVRESSPLGLPIYEKIFTFNSSTSTTS